jgi:hypothetical protein
MEWRMPLMSCPSRAPRKPLRLSISALAHSLDQPCIQQHMQIESPHEGLKLTLLPIALQVVWLN